MNSLRVLFIVPLLIGCAVGVEPEETPNTPVDNVLPDESHQGGSNEDMSSCNPYYYQVSLDGSVFVFQDPFLCHPLTPVKRPFDPYKEHEQPIDDIINPSDEIDNRIVPIDEVVVPDLENRLTPEQELIR